MSSGSKHRLAILASGAGTNAQALLTYFAAHKQIEVALIVTDRPQAGVLAVAEAFGVPALSLPAAHWQRGHALEAVKTYTIDWIILAGFLRLLPPHWVAAFPNRILNIHPALLPKYGGKGMYGRHVHAAVKAAAERETGITIHYVNEHYDEGAIISQHKVAITPAMTIEEIAAAVQQLEHMHYPAVAEQTILHNRQ